MSGQRVAYIRVSSLDQNVGRQLDGVAVDRTFTDTASGKDVTRPQLAAMLGFVREGDTVIVHSMDRLARNLEDLRRPHRHRGRIVRELTVRGPPPPKSPALRLRRGRPWSPRAVKL